MTATSNPPPGLRNKIHAAWRKPVVRVFLSLTGVALWLFWFSRHLLIWFQDRIEDPKTVFFALAATATALYVLANTVEKLFPGQAVVLAQRAKSVAEALRQRGHVSFGKVVIGVNAAGLLALLCTSSVYLKVDKDSAQKLLDKGAAAGSTLSRFKVDVLAGEQVIDSSELPADRSELLLFFFRFRPLSFRIRTPDLFQTKQRVLGAGRAVYLSIPVDFDRKEYYGLAVKPGDNLSHYLRLPERGGISPYELHVKKGNEVLLVVPDLRKRPIYLGPGLDEIRIVVHEREPGALEAKPLFQSMAIEPGDELIFELVPSGADAAFKTPKRVGWYRVAEPGIVTLILEEGPQAPSGSGTSSPPRLSLPGAPEGISHPRVAVVATIATQRIPEDQRARLKTDLETKIKERAQEAHPCMEWLSGQPEIGAPPPQAYLHVKLLDAGSVSQPQVVLTYRGEFAGGGSKSLDTKLNQVLLDPLDEAWNYELVVSKLNGLLDQFGGEDFRTLFNFEFIANVPIANEIDFDPTAKEVVVFVEAASLSLELEAPLFVILRAPLCKRDAQDCKIDLVSRGEIDGVKWDGYLTCRLHAVSCCDSFSWDNLVEGDSKAERTAVFLGGEHKHTPFVSINGHHRHPRTP